MSRLTAERAQRLWWSWRLSGAERDRERLIVAYVPLVRMLAAKVARRRRDVDADELVSCALLALVRAVDRYDPAKGAACLTFVWQRVEGSLWDTVEQASRARDLPLDHAETLPAGSGDPEAEVIALERMRAARRVLRARDTTVISLHASGASGSEVAQAMAFTESNASRVLKAARARLRCGLDAYDAAVAA